MKRIVCAAVAALLMLLSGCVRISRTVPAGIPETVTAEERESVPAPVLSLSVRPVRDTAGGPETEKERESVPAVNETAAERETAEDTVSGMPENADIAEEEIPPVAVPEPTEEPAAPEPEPTATQPAPAVTPAQETVYVTQEPEPVPAETPEPIVTPPEQTPEPSSEPVPEEAHVPEEPEPEKEAQTVFDIEYWTDLARGLALEKGLRLDPSAVYCWDDPITANERCIYLERDINSRLNRYAGDPELTAVWVWYGDLGGGKYLIYIGYA